MLQGGIGMRIGMDYYPEWDAEEMWVTDAGRMKEAGVSMVRIGEFAWSRMEPDEDRFEFGWLDRAVEVMHRHGIDVPIRRSCWTGRTKVSCMGEP